MGHFTQHWILQGKVPAVKLLSSHSLIMFMMIYQNVTHFLKNLGDHVSQTFCCNHTPKKANFAHKKNNTHEILYRWEIMSQCHAAWWHGLVVEMSSCHYDITEATNWITIVPNVKIWIPQNYKCASWTHFHSKF